MKKLLAVLTMAVSLASFAASTAPRLARADAATDKLAERAVVLVETMANLVDGDKSNCDKMGADLNRFADDTEAERALLKAYKEKLTPEQKRAYLAKYGARLQAATAKMAPGIQACGANPKVLAAMSRLSDTAI